MPDCRRSRENPLLRYICFIAVFPRRRCVFVKHETAAMRLPDKPDSVNLVFERGFSAEPPSRRIEKQRQTVREESLPRAAD